MSKFEWLGDSMMYVDPSIILTIGWECQMTVGYTHNSDGYLEIECGHTFETEMSLRDLLQMSPSATCPKCKSELDGMDSGWGVNNAALHRRGDGALTGQETEDKKAEYMELVERAVARERVTIRNSLK